MTDDIINLEHIHKSIDGREILRDVNLKVERGDIFGYLGPNGAGKTTTIRIIMGLMEASSGSVSVAGKDIRDTAARHNIGFLLEADGLYDNMSAYDNLVYYSRLYDLDQPGDRINDVLRQVGLAGRERDKVGTFSRGMRQRLGLARALAPDPEVLVLDEPTAGVDPTGQIEFRGMLQDLMKTRGKTILLSSHNLDEVQRICNRIALIHQGEIRLYGELATLQRDMGSGGVEIESREAVPPEVVAAIEELPGISVREQRDKRLYLSAGHNTDVSDIVSLLTSRGVKVEQFKRQDMSLEDLYTSIVKEAEK